MAEKTTIKSDPELLAAARLAYAGGLGQEFWAEVAQRLGMTAPQANPQVTPEVEPLPRRETSGTI